MAEKRESDENPQKKSRGQRGKGKGVRTDHRLMVYAVAAALVKEPFVTPQRLADIAWPELTSARGRKTAHERVRRGLEELAERPELADTLAEAVMAALLAREVNAEKIAHDRELQKVTAEAKKRRREYLLTLEADKRQRRELQKAKMAYIESRLGDAESKGIKIGRWPKPLYGNLGKECSKIMKIARCSGSYVSASDIQNQLVIQDAEDVNKAQNRDTITRIAEAEWNAGLRDRIA